MLIPVLDRRHYVRAIRQPSSPGWNPTTHLARLHHPAAGEIDAWLKIDSQLMPFLGNEAIGWLMARTLEIPTPEHAAILVENVEWFRALLGDRYPTDNFLPQSGDVAAWCTSDMGSGPIKSVAPFDDWNLLAFLRTEEGAQVAAFDHWLGNEDRNTGNLIRLPRGRYAVIDHGILFCYQDWRKRHLQPACTSFLLNKAGQFLRDKRLSQKEYKALQAAMAEFGYRHHRAAGACHPAIDVNISQIADFIAARNVLSCISARCSHRWIADQVGMLA
jgi:hypothetical protein